MAWGFSSCLFLWLFSLAQIKDMASPPTIGELFDSFILFSFMLLGGGACYHFLTEILSSPYNSRNQHIWDRLMKNMILMMLILVSAPIVILVCRDNFSTGLAWVVSYFYLLLSLGSALWVGAKIEPAFREIHSNKTVRCPI